MCESSPDILYQAACIWWDLTQYQYNLTYGLKNRLHVIHLTFFPEDFPHLAGFQYLKDISLPRYNSNKVILRILDKTITLASIQKAQQFEKMVLPRLHALLQLKETLEHDFLFYSYIPHRYPFYTKIKADYFIVSPSNNPSFVFLIQSHPDTYSCCSTFEQTDRDYRQNQHSLALLRKEQIHLATQTSTILYDRPSSKQENSL